MTTKETNERTSGRTYIKDGVIIWETDKSKMLTRIPIKDIRVVGEYTNSNGPIEDDWFFVFILDKEDVREISAYAIGTEEIFKEFGHLHNTEVYGQLATSTDWKTNILWPTSLRGHDLFKLTEKRPTSIWEKLKSKIGLNRQEVELTDDLRKYLSERASA